MKPIRYRSAMLLCYTICDNHDVVATILMACITLLVNQIYLHEKEL